MGPQGSRGRMSESARNPEKIYATQIKNERIKKQCSGQFGQLNIEMQIHHAHAVLNAQCCAKMPRNNSWKIKIMGPWKTKLNPSHLSYTGTRHNAERKKTDRAAAAAQATGTCRQPSKRSQPAGQSANKVDRQNTVKQAGAKQTDKQDRPEFRKNKTNYPTR